MKLSLWAYHFTITDRLVVSHSSTTSCLVLHPLLFPYSVSPQVSAGYTRSTINPLLVKLPKSRITAHLHSFVCLSPHLLNQLPHSLQSHSSLQVFKTPVHHHLRSSPSPNMILSTLITHPTANTPIPPHSTHPVFPPQSFLLYPSCPPHASSSVPHSSPHPLFVQVCLYLGLQLCCWCFLPLSTGPFVLLCPDLFSILARPQASPMYTKTNKQTNKKYCTCSSLIYG